MLFPELELYVNVDQGHVSSAEGGSVFFFFCQTGSHPGPVSSRMTTPSLREERWSGEGTLGLNETPVGSHSSHIILRGIGCILK